MATKYGAPVITNPYAKKSAKTTSSPPTGLSDNLSTNGNHANARALTSERSAVSFSQAFHAIEGTAHYQNQVADAGFIDELSSDKVEQRTFEASIAEAENLDGSSNTDVAWKARDHHVLLQPHVLYVSTKQRGNGVLKHIRNVPVAFSTMVPDYIMSSTRCALFLSCKYHSLYPNYIHRRIAELKTDFQLRVLLVLVDVEDNANTILFLNKLAVTNNLTLILAWSEEEAARYLETYKAFDGKDASSIQRREQTNFVDQMADVLSTAKSVNKNDSANLLSHFSSLKAVMAASMDELALCPGLGEKKVKRLHDAFHKPFSKHAAAKRKKEKMEGAMKAPPHSTATIDNEQHELTEVSNDPVPDPLPDANVNVTED